MNQPNERSIHLRVQLFALQALLQEVEHSVWLPLLGDSDGLPPPDVTWKRDIVKAARAELQFASHGGAKPSATRLLKLSEGLDAALLKDADYGRFSGLLSAVRSVRVASEVTSVARPPGGHAPR